MRWVFGSLILAIMFAFPAAINSVDMTSENYKVFVDVISVGGDLTTSTSYQVNSTIGEAAGVHETVSTSTNYNLAAGFQAMANVFSLSATLSTNAIALGALSTGAISTVAQTITVTTNATNGYTVTVQEDGELRSGSNAIPDANGDIAAGTAAYGIRTSGNAGKMNDIDTAITAAAKTLASTSTPATSEATSITYKATAGSNTADGSYSQTLTFTTVANY